MTKRLNMQILTLFQSGIACYLRWCSLADVQSEVFKLMNGITSKAGRTKRQYNLITPS